MEVAPEAEELVAEAEELVAVAEEGRGSEMGGYVIMTNEILASCDCMEELERQDDAELTCMHELEYEQQVLIAPESCYG
jgi:hypothetical protein